jgi:4-amino-4-deoxy-L-arabinose transferase-like glycosyltransferase
LTSRPRLADALLLGGALVVAGIVFGRGLHAAANYDEGVYVASLDALTHGQSLGRDVYASQPPGFYTLLRAVSLLPSDGVAALRVPFLLVALVGVAAAFAIGQKVAPRWGGISAGSLLMVTAPYPIQAPRIQADTASVVLSLCAFAALVYARRRFVLAAAAGALAGAAVSVKLLALPVVVPIAVLLVAWRSWRLAGAVAAGAAAVWLGIALAYAGAIPELWRSAVRDHRLARHLGPSLSDNVHRVLVHPLDWKTPAGILVPIGLVCAVVLCRRVETFALLAWIATSVLFLVLQRPLLDHHFVLLAGVLGVTAGCGLGAAVDRAPGRWPAVAAVFVVVAIGLGAAQESRRLDRQGGETASVRSAAAELRTHTAPGELVATDLPILAYLADRRVPGQLVDTSFVRLGSGSLTDAEILAELERHHIRAVAVGRAFAEQPALLAALRARYPTRSERGGITLYLRPRS